MVSIDIEEVLSKLSTVEKIQLLAGIDFWHTKPLSNHGVPSLRMTDGPNGARGPKFFNGEPAACFPCGTALGALWDEDLLLEAGRLMGEETKAKGSHVLLGPTVNMQRSPLGGRGFESFSEDPVLAGMAAGSIINGIQETGVSATIKHFVCNDQEHERLSVNAIITERALREIYLLAFQIAIRDSNPAAVMTAYNKVNGVHVSENEKIISRILRGEWGWNGTVMSDWYGTYSTTESIKAGLDIEMPGPSRWRGDILGHALSSNKVRITDIDDRARGVLKLVNSCAKSNVPENANVGGLGGARTGPLLRRCAAESIVLLKNEKNVLPFSKDKPVLVIGPNAKVATFCGGGSASLLPYYVVTPLDGIKSKVKNHEVQYALGCYTHKDLPLLGTQVTTKSDSDSQLGTIFRVYKDPPETEYREVVDQIDIVNTYMLLPDYENPKLKEPLWYADLECYFHADRDGEFEFGLCVSGTSKLYVDGELVIDNETTQRPGEAFFGNGTVEETGSYRMDKDQTYRIHVTFASSPSSKLRTMGATSFPNGGVRIGGCWKLDPGEEVKHAAALAKDASQLVIYAGLNMDWEGEGADRKDMNLPGYTDKLISSVADANPNVVVVMQSGTPVEMPWLSKVSSLVQAWYGGNETGNAIADVLFGNVNPSGKLPLSFPLRVQDNPAFLNYRSEGGRTLYGEDVYVGYRWYEALERSVAFPFGHGLSYSTFRLTDLKIDTDTDSNILAISVDLINTGSIPGAEVVQVYISQVSPSIRRPPKELKGFGKSFLGAAERKTVEIKIPLKYATSFWDESRDAWMMEKGQYEVIVGTSSEVGEGHLNGAFEVQKTSWWNGI